MSLCHRFRIMHMAFLHDFYTPILVLFHYLNLIFLICFYYATVNFVKIVLACAAITKYLRQSGSNHRCIFFCRSGVQKSKNKMPIALVPGENTFLVYRQPLSHCILTWERESERVSSGPSSFAHNDTSPIMGVLPS